MGVHDKDRYTMLISSLPHPHSLFHEKVPPLSRIKLEKRLAVLLPEHKRLLSIVEDILDWRKLQGNLSHQDITRRGKYALAKIHNPTLQQIIQTRLEMRTFLLALRMRKLGQPEPEGSNWAFGRWQQHIVRHWHEPGFQLQHVYRWALKAEQLLNDNESRALETLLLDEAYKQLQRYTAQHVFDFEAVVIYVLKWNIIDRIVRYNSHSAERRFRKLLTQSLKQSQGDLTCLTPH